MEDKVSGIPPASKAPLVIPEDSLLEVLPYFVNLLSSLEMTLQEMLSGKCISLDRVFTVLHKISQVELLGSSCATCSQGGVHQTRWTYASNSSLEAEAQLCGKKFSQVHK